MKYVKQSWLLALFFFSAYAISGVTVLTFDEFEHGQIIDDEYFASFGVTVNSVNYINGVIGDSDDVEGRQVAFKTYGAPGSTRDSDLEYYNANNDYLTQYAALSLPGYTSPHQHPGNILILQENDIGCEDIANDIDGICDQPDDEGNRPGGYFEFIFSEAVTILNIDFFDVEDKASQPEDHYALQFFDGSDNELFKDAYFVPTMDDGQHQRENYATLGIDGVTRLRVNLPGSGGIDNLAFTTTQVSEPETLALVGVALLGLFGLRRRSA